MQNKFSGIVLVWVAKHTQLERLKRRDGLDDETAQLRLSAQLPLDDKRSKATWCIDNDGTQEQTHEQVLSVWRALTGFNANAGPDENKSRDAPS